MKIEIELPEGYEKDEEKSTSTTIVFKKIENKLPMTWEELKIVNGFYITKGSDIEQATGCDTYSGNRNIFPSQEEVEACLALSQLLQLRDRWNEGWKPDWKNQNQVKCCLRYFGEVLGSENFNSTRKVLTFKNLELAEKFMETFKSLIETAKPLL